MGNPTTAAKQHSLQTRSPKKLRAEAPPGAALDAPRSSIRQSLVVRDEGDNRDLKRVLRNCHQRFFEERAFMKLGSVLDRSKHRRLK